MSTKYNCLLLFVVVTHAFRQVNEKLAHYGSSSETNTQTLGLWCLSLMRLNTRTTGHVSLSPVWTQSILIEFIWSTLCRVREGPDPCGQKSL